MTIKDDFVFHAQNRRRHHSSFHRLAVLSMHLLSLKCATAFTISSPHINPLSSGLFSSESAKPLSLVTTTVCPTINSSTNLCAKKQKKKTSNRATRNKMGKRTASASGFGGAAVEPCPCGSGLGYMKCCGKIHKDPDAYAAATPEQVVRARYSAYAKREVSVILFP